jgi:hypothetical protein
MENPPRSKSHCHTKRTNASFKCLFPLPRLPPIPVKNTQNRTATKKKKARTMTIENSPTSTITSTPGMAGRTNYAKWDKIATTLVQQVEDRGKGRKAKVCELSFLLAGLFFRFLGSVSTKQQQTDALLTRSIHPSFFLIARIGWQIRIFGR